MEFSVALDQRYETTNLYWLWGLFFEIRFYLFWKLLLRQGAEIIGIFRDFTEYLFPLFNLVMVQQIKTPFNTSAIF